MNKADIIGTVGVAMILFAYFCNIFKLIPKDGRLFYLLNIVGSAMTCYSSWLIIYWPFVVLEGVWCVVSVAGLLNSPEVRKGGSPKD
jgi:hypothetical protein